MSQNLFEKRHYDRMLAWGRLEANKLAKKSEPMQSIKIALCKPNLTAFNNGVRSITD